MRDAFRDAVERAGLEVGVQKSYAADATAFGRVVSELADEPFDALFVPDSARRIALVAPALAAGGLWSTPAGETPPRGGRPITLLLPSVAFDASLARSSGRYLQGAVFSVLFHAPTATGAGRTFADGFAARYGTAPDAFAAQAYDALRLVRTAVDGGASTRVDVATRLAGMRTDTAGPSGGFTVDRGPTGATRLLVLDGTLFRAP
jgi:ABC-type branched-subunit amino acid transport system substrate-binding protein